MTSLTSLPANTHETPALKSVLTKDGFAGTVIDLPPGSTLPESDFPLDHEQFLFLTQGEATIRSGQVNTILSRDQALLLGKGRKYSVAASSTTAARLLRLDIPARQVVSPPLETLRA